MSDRAREIEIQDPGLGQTNIAVAEVESPVRVDTTPGHEGLIKSGRLAGLTMWHAILVLSWPVLAESFLNALVGVVDTTLAAGLSEAATDAIGAGSYITWLMAMAGMSLGVGATAMVSRAMGKGRVSAANAAVGQCATVSLIVGVVFGVFVAAMAPVFASWLNLGGEARDSAVAYLRIIAIGAPLIAFLEGGIASCRGAGDTVRPLMAMVVVNIVNIVASFVLSGVDIAVSSLDAAGEVQRNVILANPFGFDLGVVGIAIGTVVAWATGALVMLGVLIRGTHGLRLRAKRLAPHWITSWRLLRLGLPNFLETLGMWFGNFLTLLMVGWIGVPGLMGAHIVAIRIEAFSFLPGFAMSLAAATLAGQYLGARSPRLARLAIIRCALIASVIMGVVGGAFMLVPRPIVGIFSQQPTHLELAPWLLVVCGYVQIPFAIAMVMRGGVRGAGATTSVMWITWISTYAVRLPLAWLCCGVDIPLPNGMRIPNPAPLQHWFGTHPLIGFWIGLCAELAIRGMMFLGLFLHGGWQRARV